MKGVSLRAKMSVGTISNVINCPQQVAPSTFERVTQAIEELGFTRNETARQHRAGKPDAVGLMITDNSNPFCRELVRGAQGVAVSYGVAVTVVDLADSLQAEATLPRLATRHHPRGMLLTWATDESRVLALASAGTRTVYVDQPPRDKANAVSINCKRSPCSRAPGRYGMSPDRLHRASVLGHTSIRPLGRSEGCRGPNPVITIELEPIGSPSVAKGRPTRKRLAALPALHRPDAIFARNDLLATGVLQALNGGPGCSIPRDVSLVSYANIGLAAAVVAPPTSLRQPSSRWESSQCKCWSMS